MSRHIRSWSGVHKAKDAYPCAGCPYPITIGQVHHSFVMSDDDVNPAHTAYRVRHHLDCAAPWYQPSDVQRLKHVGQIPRAEPPQEAMNLLLEDLPDLSVCYQSSTAGKITWVLPKNLSRRILYMPNLKYRAAVIFELEMALATQVEETVAVASHPKKAKKLGDILYSVQLQSSYSPREYDWDMDLDEDQ